MISVKICGLSTPEAVRAVIAAGAEYAGFVHFPKSPRHIAPASAAPLKVLLPPSIRSVSVTVDPDDALLEQTNSTLAPDYLQLHGNETPQRIRAIRTLFPQAKIIKAIAIRSASDIALAAQYYDCADMLLFDAKPLSCGPRSGSTGSQPDPALSLRSPQDGLLPGGNGIAFDWTVLQGQSFPLPWFLSGGLNAQNVAQAIRATGATLVDVSSGVESAPGVKDAALIDAFVKAVKL